MMSKEREGGLTLIELVVAMAIFALMAVMGVQALSGMLVQRDALSGRAVKERDLLYATALLRADPRQVLPLLFFPPDGASPRSAVADRTGGGVGFSLSTAVPRPEGQGPGLGRVAWWIDAESGRLMRQSWPTLWPAAATQVGPEVAVLDGDEYVLNGRKCFITGAAQLLGWFWLAAGAAARCAGSGARKCL